MVDPIMDTSMANAGAGAVASASGYTQGAGNYVRISPNFDLAGRPNSARRFIDKFNRRLDQRLEARHGIADQGHGSLSATRVRRERSRE